MDGYGLMPRDALLDLLLSPARIKAEVGPYEDAACLHPASSRGIAGSFLQGSAELARLQVEDLSLLLR